MTLTTGFHAQAGSRFSAAVNTTGKVWRRRYYYGEQSSDANARGRLVKVEVNDDMDLSADVIEEYSYDRRGNMLTKKLSILETGDVSTISYKYNYLGEVVETNYGGGIDPVVYGYDALGRLKVADHNAANNTYDIGVPVGSQSLADAWLLYDTSGNISRRNKAEVNTRFACYLLARPNIPAADLLHKHHGSNTGAKTLSFTVRI